MVSIMKLGNHNVPGIDRVSEHYHGFFIQRYADGSWRTWLKAPSRLGSPRDPFVDPIWHFAIN